MFVRRQQVFFHIKQFFNKLANFIDTWQTVLHNVLSKFLTKFNLERNSGCLVTLEWSLQKFNSSSTKWQRDFNIHQMTLLCDPLLIMLNIVRALARSNIYASRVFTHIYLCSLPDTTSTPAIYLLWHIDPLFSFKVIQLKKYTNLFSQVNKTPTYVGI